MCYSPILIFMQRDQTHYRACDKIKNPRKHHDLTIPLLVEKKSGNRYEIKCILVKAFFFLRVN